MDLSGKENGRAITQCQKQTKPLPLLSLSLSLSPRYFFIQKMFGLSLSVPLCRSRGAHVLFKQNVLLELPYSSEKKFFGKQSSKKDGLHV